MATRALHFCGHVGCRTLTADSYCAEHAPLHEVREDHRDSASARGYDSLWHKVRNRYIASHPLCERCGERGLTVVASVVHHKVPLDQGGARFDQTNLMALCRDCHEQIHGRQRG
jgi:5-methylcytosine-specific restriction enzyme A